MRLSVIIPVYNERELFPVILTKVRGSLPKVTKEIIIVDDCSRDGTRDWIEQHFGLERRSLIGFAPADDGTPLPQFAATNADVTPEQNLAPCTVQAIFHPHNQGKGAALRTGLKAATGDVIVIQDADLEYDPTDWESMYPLIADGHADVVYGSRFFGRPHRCLYYHHFLANKLISVIFSILYNQILSDLEVCYKMFRKEILPLLTLRSNDFGFEIEFSANVARARRLRIYEVGISYYGRTYAEGKKINWRDGVKALWYLLRFRVT